MTITKFVFLPLFNQRSWHSQQILAYLLGPFLVLQLEVFTPATPNRSCCDVVILINNPFKGLAAGGTFVCVRDGKGIKEK